MDYVRPHMELYFQRVGGLMGLRPEQVRMPTTPVRRFGYPTRAGGIGARVRTRRAPIVASRRACTCCYPGGATPDGSGMSSGGDCFARGAGAGSLTSHPGRTSD